MNPKITYYPNGNKKIEFYYNDLGQFHNEVGPAIIIYFENGNKHFEDFYINGKLHNIKGPAFITFNKNGEMKYKEYWLNNKEITITCDEEFRKYINKLILS